MTISRRQFMASATAPLILSNKSFGATAPSNRINLGCIGVGSMGGGNMRRALDQEDCRVVAVCDVDMDRVDDRLMQVNEFYGGADCKGFMDYRELLEIEDLDAVMIATPDHWHAPIGIAAARRGLDVYCEKPVTHTHAAGKKLASEVEKAGVIWQTGSQQRSEQRWRRAVEIVRNGLLGEVIYAEVGLPSGNPFPPEDGEFEIPAAINYDFWSGPSPVLPYHPGRLHWDWRWNHHYAGGQLLDWIGHHNDILHWMLDLEDTGPVEVETVQFDRPRERNVWDAAWRYEGYCVYANGLRTRITNRARQGVTVFGSEGWLFISRGSHDMSNPEWADPGFDPGPVKVYSSDHHWRNFLDCVKSREPAIAPVEAAHRSITPGHLMLISAEVEAKLEWDPEAEEIVGNDEAAKLLAQQGEVMPWKPWRTDWCDDYLLEADA